MSLLKFRNQKGFTLIEMMIVIAVIAILAAVIIPKSGLVQSTAKEAGVEANARVVQGIIENMLPKYEANTTDDDLFRAALIDKLNGKVNNPITGKSTAVDVAALAIAPPDSSVVVSTVYGDDNPSNAGVVWVEITDNLAKINIIPHDSNGDQIEYKQGKIK